MKVQKSDPDHEQENGWDAQPTQGKRSLLWWSSTCRDVVCASQATELFRQRSVAQFLGIEINQVYPDVAFHLPFAQIVEERPPMRVLLEVFGYMLRDQDMPGVPAIHYYLGDVDPGPGHIR